MGLTARFFGVLMGVVRVVLTDSPDVACALGATGTLGDRLRGGDEEAPQVEIETVPGARLDLLTQRARGMDVPELELPAGLEAWFSANFTGSPLAGDPLLVVVSGSEAITSTVLRHRRLGFLASEVTDPTSEQAQWLENEFEVAPLDTEAIRQAMIEFDALCGTSQVEVVIFNVSTYIPDESPHWFKLGQDEPLSMLANRLDLAIDQAASTTRFSVLDIDRIAAEYGAGEAVESPGRYSKDACAVMREEALNLIVDLPEVSRVFGRDVMRLVVPRHDRRTTDGVLVEWHVEAPCEVKSGDDLFDIRYENIRARLDTSRNRGGRALQMTVVASRDGYLKEVTVGEGKEISAGSTVGIVTENADVGNTGVEGAANFPVGVRVAGR